MEQKKILLGVSGGIAAYKAIELARLFTKGNVQVTTVMTQNALEFIQPLSFSAVTGQDVFTSNFASNQDAMLHITLAKQADAIVLAPATASLLGKLANGIYDDLLTTTVCASSASVFIAPAMNKVMWEHFAVQSNVNILRKAAFEFLGPCEGSQACGDFGFGRMMEPEDIARSVLSHLNSSKTQRFLGVKVLITAGPTQEALDPVRYISNHSSGKMGFALAEALQNQGADVTLISGPTSVSVPAVSRVLNIRSTEELWNAVQENISDVDIFISAAAVCDFYVKTISDHKIKKKGDCFSLELHPTRDILASVASMEKSPFCVGFAAETDNLIENARLKLERKNLHLIVANLVSSDFNPFYNDENEVLVMDRTGKEYSLPRASKKEIALGILDVVFSLLRVPWHSPP